MKYNIGDKIKCLPGFNNDRNWINELSGGGGYIDGGVFTIISIDKNRGYDEVLWFKEISLKGVFSQAVTLYNHIDYEIY